jgi:hypothetical protein
MPAKGWRKRQTMQWIPNDEAIAEAKKQEPVAWRVTYRDFENIPQLTFLPHEVHPDSPLAKNGKGLMQEPLYTHPLPKQEPVAMRYDFDGYGYKYIDNGSGSDWQTRIKDAEPVFAHPQPKREWVGLTDEDIKEIIGYYGDLNVNGYARQLFAKIEAKLREKNT